MNHIIINYYASPYFSLVSETSACLTPTVQREATWSAAGSDNKDNMVTFYKSRQMINIDYTWLPFRSPPRTLRLHNNHDVPPLPKYSLQNRPHRRHHPTPIPWLHLRAYHAVLPTLQHTSDDARKKTEGSSRNVAL